MQRCCLALDLRCDSLLIAEYVRLHQQVWPEIRKSIRDTGVLDMQIYRIGNRLFMIMDAEDSFSFDKKAVMDAANSAVQRW